MKNFLTTEEESELKLRHKEEEDGRTRDRIKDYKTVNSESIEDFFKFWSEQYPGQKLHVFLDNGPYFESN
ncbi:hypothetical protein FACS189449_03900 [Alphaproteobacteria bacterium]|nr:hypothetical protein FACS189449_03900 [Alphaproteobacteria bacterium]